MILRDIIILIKSGYNLYNLIKIIGFTIQNAIILEKILYLRRLFAT
jgi:hypothetical protein